MKLNIDVRDKHFTVSKDPAAKVDTEGVQYNDKGTKNPLWITQVFVRDEEGGSVIEILTAGERPDVKAGEEVEVDGLYAYEWTSRRGRHGINFRADDIILPADRWSGTAPRGV